MSINSWTGSYLLAGIKTNLLYHFDSKKNATAGRFIARSIYSLGLMGVAPCGMFYHLGKALACHLQALFRQDQKTCLKERAWCHLQAGLQDLTAVSHVFLQTTIAISAVASAVLFGISIAVGSVGGLCFSLASCAIYAAIAYLFRDSLISWQYAKNPAYALQYLSDSILPGQREYSERDCQQFILLIQSLQKSGFLQKDFVPTQEDFTWFARECKFKDPTAATHALIERYFDKMLLGT